ncbi:MAG TPA: hypothetical protein DEG17_19015 [Cyanobacteria bacterium UBA11149]|nr:hypothetical protein [Cyanobacteria bacterium UBA11367]HBE56214.1 hypothetical protein [Cyanobacteria bacterium UBA11366]HBK66010.1 hypothetical protein [Cyanobacteria bacterium UBA11166]HBR74718.1 hypothetical protein [Cyanobacteria bacterium UBA11159]HBS70318.1 hypothetical protein [Cyanobacteria bacterium UBA11153]HBW90902.1 hypothetical protein [Cyanobacteria bacterium UBA11149]HCA96752.1 hypothetical protein [Cyanobacteria bacterium UBA9226]
MSNPVIHAFFVGRAMASSIGELLEDSLTNALSEAGKFDAQQREKLRQFTQQVMERAEKEAAMTVGESTNGVSFTSPAVDLQETIDDLRAEIASLRTELQTYRNKSPA